MGILFQEEIFQLDTVNNQESAPHLLLCLIFIFKVNEYERFRYDVTYLRLFLLFMTYFHIMNIIQAFNRVCHRRTQNGNQ